MKRNMQAIETLYAGVKFRSRLEARWAVFFDTVGVKWEYEAEGYKLPSGEQYLPDFFIPVQSCTSCPMIFEVKPEGITHSQREARKVAEFAASLSGHPDLPIYYVACGSPWYTTSLMMINPRDKVLATVHFGQCPCCLNKPSEFHWFVIGRENDGSVSDAYYREVFKRLTQHPRLMAAYQVARSARFE